MNPNYTQKYKEKGENASPETAPEKSETLEAFQVFHCRPDYLIIHAILCLVPFHLLEMHVIILTEAPSLHNTVVIKSGCLKKKLLAFW